MKRLFIILLLASATSAFSQTATVTAQITDPSGLRYANCTYTITFKDSPSLPPGQQSTSQGIPLSNAQKTLTGTCDASGNLSVTTLSNIGNNSVQPQGSTWTYAIKAQGGTPSFSVVLTYGSGPINVSSQLSGSAPPLSNFAYLAFYGLPTGTCQALQLAVDVTTGNTYSCNNGAWVASGSGGGGGISSINGSTAAAQTIAGATPIVVASASGTTTVSCPTCGTATGGGTVTHSSGPLVAPSCVYGNDGGDITVDTVCTLDGLGNMIETSLQTTGDGVHPGVTSYQVNTTDPTLPVNTFSIIGPNAASMTSYGIQFPSTAPATGLCLKTGNITAGGKLPITAGACGGTGGGGPLWLGPKANLGVGQGNVVLGAATGCSLVGSYTGTAAPIFYGLTGSTTLRQTCKPQFTVNGTNGATSTTVMYYADTMSFYYVTNAPLTFRIKAFHPTAITGADVFSMTYTCTSATAEPPFSAAQSFPSVTVNGTAGGSQAGQNEEQVELVLTPGSGLPACNPSDTIQIGLSLLSTTASDNPVVMFFGGHP